MEENWSESEAFQEALKGIESLKSAVDRMVNEVVSIEGRLKNTVTTLDIVGLAKRGSCRHINLQGYCLNPCHSKASNEFWEQNKVETVFRYDDNYYPKVNNLWCSMCSFYESRAPRK